MAQVTIQSGALQSFLSKHSSKLASGTTIIISSSEAPRQDKIQKTDRNLERFHNKLGTQIKQCHFMTTLQFNLRTVTYGGGGIDMTPSMTTTSQQAQNLSSAFPTTSNVRSAVEMMKRVGVTNVLGVGSGVAMDLAKVCYSYLRQNQESSSDRFGDCAEGELILVPGTLGAVMASVSSEELLLSTEEEALIPSSYERNVSGQDIENSKISSSNAPYHVLIDEKMISIPEWMSFTSSSMDYNEGETESRSIIIAKERKNVATMTDVALASLVICADIARQLDEEGMESGQNHSDNDSKASVEKAILDCTTHANVALQSIVSMRNEDDEGSLMETARYHAIQTALLAGNLLTFGVDDNVSNESQRQRSIAYAISSSLLPRYFPHGNWLTVTASLLPGIRSAYQANGMLHSGPEHYPLLHRVISESEIDDIPIPCLTNFAHGAPGITELLDQMNANGALLHCNDADSSHIERVLLSSLNR